jgi:hypothetical protein
MEVPGTDGRGTEPFQFLKIVEERNGTDLYYFGPLMPEVK